MPTGDLKGRSGPALAYEALRRRRAKPMPMAAAPNRPSAPGAGTGVPPDEPPDEPPLVLVLVVEPPEVDEPPLVLVVEPPEVDELPLDELLLLLLLLELVLDEPV